MSSTERRQSPRYPARLGVAVAVGSTEERLVTAEVGLRGVFIETPRPRPLRQLVSLTFTLPDGRPFVAHGLVARRVEPAQADPPFTPAGMGIQFYGLSERASQRWESFLEQARQRSAQGETPCSTVVRLTPGASPTSSPVMSETLASPEPPREPRPEEALDEAPPFGLDNSNTQPDLLVPNTKDELTGLDGPSTTADQGPAIDEAPAQVSQVLRFPAPPLHTTSPSPAEPRRRERRFIEEEIPTQVLPPRAPREVPAEDERRPPSLAPEDMVGAVVYQLALPTVEALKGFRDNALNARGVFVRTADIRPPGTPAVVSVVHPLSGDEFHLSGEVVPLPRGRPGVAVQLQGVTARTISDFDIFIALGIPDEDDGPAPVSWAAPESVDPTDELSSFKRVGPSGPPLRRENTHEVAVDDLIPLIDETDPPDDFS